VPWYYAVAERDHDIQNPTNGGKIRLLGEHLRLGPDSRVLDVASGKGGPALRLAEEFGCRVTGVEQAAEFFETACRRARAAHLDRLIEFVHTDAREYPLTRGEYDVAMCLGASFIWAGLAGTLEALRPAVRAGGYVVVGEPYWTRDPLPAGFEPDEDDRDFVALAETADRFHQADLPVVAVIASSQDDWDRYQALHWRAVEEWLAENGDDADADEIRRRHERARDRYLRWERDLLGWAIFVGWRRPQFPERIATDS
jgi:SAM-dependent methyltransferase